MFCSTSLSGKNVCRPCLVELGSYCRSSELRPSFFLGSVCIILELPRVTVNQRGKRGELLGGYLPFATNPSLLTHGPSRYIEKMRCGSSFPTEYCFFLRPSSLLCYRSTTDWDFSSLSAIFPLSSWLFLHCEREGKDGNFFSLSANTSAESLVRPLFFPSTIIAKE